MSVIETKLHNCLLQIDVNKKITVAYSGGIDSSVLLHATNQACGSSGHFLQAIYIDHQLHPDSQQWGKHCIECCKLLEINIDTIQVDVQQYSDLGGEGAAREARYQAFANHLKENDVLLTGHHADDQIESVLLQLFRGTGLLGLAGCAPARAIGKATLMRPLLEVSRQGVEQYAQRHQLKWLDDPSNKSLVHDRNYLRHEVMPLLHSRWQGLRETIARSSQWQGESAQMLNDLAIKDLDSDGEVLYPLAIQKVNHLNEARLKNVLRWWIRSKGFNVPSAEVLAHIIEDAVYSRDDCDPRIHWQGYEVRKYQGHLYLQYVLPSHDAKLNYEWDLNQPLEILSSGVILTRKELVNYGVALDGVDRLQVRFRVGGEVMRPRGRGCQKDLKALFQEEGVEPWLRDRIPLLFHKQQLIFVWGYWIGEGY